MQRVLCALMAVATLAWAGSAEAQSLTLTRRSVTGIGSSTTTDQNGASFTIAGLSGITYAGGNTFWAVMDNSNKLVRLNLSFSSNGSISAASVAGGLTLSQSKDHEGIAISSGGTSVFVSEETTPAIHEYSLTNGAKSRTLSLPAIYNNRVSNFGLESLSRTGSALWTANEEALTVDGALSNETTGTWVRLQKFTIGSGGAVTTAGQYAYRTEPIHKDANDVPPREAADYSRSGLADMVALPDGRILALERSFARAGFLDSSSEYRNRIFLVNPSGATDISAMGSLTGGGFTAASKSTALWSYNTSLLTSPQIGNLEGLCLGPQLANGNWIILGIVDNGDGQLSGNTLVSFELAGVVPEPGTLSLLSGLALLALRRRQAWRAHC